MVFGLGVVVVVMIVMVVAVLMVSVKGHGAELWMEEGGRSEWRYGRGKGDGRDHAALRGDDHRVVCVSTGGEDEDDRKTRSW